MKKALVLILVSLFTLTLFAGCIGSENDNMSDEEFGKAYNEALENFVYEDYNTSITYDVLLRNPNSQKGKLVKYTGEILQFSPKSNGDADVYHIAVDGDVNNVIWSQTSASGKSVVDDVSKGDIVDIYGKIYGITDRLPVIYIVKMEKVEESAKEENRVSSETKTNSTVENSVSSKPNNSSAAENKLGTRLNPFPLNQMATFDGMDMQFASAYNYIVEITAVEVIRGNEATKIFDNAPEEGKEFFLMKFKVKAIESKDDRKIEMNNAQFSVISKNGIKYSGIAYTTGGPKELDDLYAGSETEGYIYQIIDAGDEPTVAFHEGLSGKSIWFKTK